METLPQSCHKSDFNKSPVVAVGYRWKPLTILVVVAIMFWWSFDGFMQNYRSVVHFARQIYSAYFSCSISA